MIYLCYYCGECFNLDDGRLFSDYAHDLLMCAECEEGDAFDTGQEWWEDWIKTDLLR